MKCPYITTKNCHRDYTKGDVAMDRCADCQNHVADTIIRKWTTQGARSRGMENNILRLLEKLR